MKRDDRGVATMATLLTTVGLGLLGAVANIGGWILAAEGSDIGPIASGGGTVTLAGALVWIVKKFFSGELVVRDVAKSERSLLQLQEESLRREEELKRVISELRRERRRQAP